MTYWLDEPRYQHELVTVRTLWVTIGLSLLVHFVALLVVLQKTHLLAPDEGGKELEADRLQVHLTAPERPPIQVPEPPREILALPKAQARPPRTAARTPSGCERLRAGTGGSAQTFTRPSQPEVKSCVPLGWNDTPVTAPP